MKFKSQLKSKLTSDTTPITRMIERLKAIDNNIIEYGYYDDQYHSSGKLSMSHIAYIHNYGDDSSNIPARPFMDQTNDKLTIDYQVKNEWKNDLWDYLSDKKGKSVNIRTLYTKFAREAVDTIPLVIDAQNFLPLSPSWEAYKVKTYGQSFILIESRDLYELAEYNIIKNEVV